MSETGGGTEALESAITQRLEASQELIEASRFRRRLFGGLLTFLCVSLVAIMAFQAWQNYQGNLRRRGQDNIIKDLSGRITADDAFFDTVRKLLLLPPNATPDQRQAILNELQQQQAAREQQNKTPAKGSGKVPGGGSTVTSVHSSPNTTTKSTSPSTSSPPSTQSPRPTTVPPPPPPPAQVCLNGTCVTAPSIPLPKTRRS